MPPVDPSRYTYFYGPFRLESDLEIPELRDVAGPGTRRVSVTLGPVPRALDHPMHAGTCVQFTPTEYLLNIPGTARYYVRDGAHVTVEPVPGAPLPDITTFLLGSVFGALCHQNGLLPLHASAIASGDSVTAFLGNSGAGKSTLAACLQRRRHAIVSDDICLIDPSANPPQVIPVAGWLKLWNQSLEHLGEAPVEQHRVFSTDDKFRVFLPPAADAPTRKLARVVFLESALDPNAKPSLLPMPIPQAVAALMDMTYAAYIPVLSGGQAQLFRTCAALLQQAQPFRLIRPWSLNRFDDVLDLLERDLLAPTESRSAS